MKCYICQKETRNEKYVVGWTVLCSKECEDKRFKESYNDFGCKTCEDKCEIPK